MAGVNTGEGCLGLALPDLRQKISGLMSAFFKPAHLTKKARVWHGVFSYPLIPNTAIKNFHNMSAVTTIDAGECYVCVFDQDDYAGQYRIICPGERISVGHCASLVVAAQKPSVHAVRDKTAFPGDYWELDGPMYLLHFSSRYRYV